MHKVCYLSYIQGLTPFRRPLLPFEASWGPHERLFELAGGGLWGSRERLGASWGRLGASWGLLGDLEVVLSCHGAVLGRGWRRLGALSGPLGTILRPSWALLGAFWRFFWASRRRLGASSGISRLLGDVLARLGDRKSEIIKNPSLFQGF